VSRTTAIRLIEQFLKKNGPFAGSSYQLSKACGVPMNALWPALNQIRSRAFIDANGWTVPYIGHGRLGSWSVTTGKNASTMLHAGTRIRGADLLSSLRRWDAHCDLGVATMNPTSAEAQWMNAMGLQVKAWIAAGEVLGL